MIKDYKDSKVEIDKTQAITEMQFGVRRTLAIFLIAAAIGISTYDVAQFTIFLISFLTWYHGGSLAYYVITLMHYIRWLKPSYKADIKRSDWLAKKFMESH